MWLVLAAAAAVGVASPPACRAGLGSFQPSHLKIFAADGFLAWKLARRAPAVPIHDHGPLFFHF